MIKQLSAVAVALFMCAGVAHAADAATCEKQAIDKNGKALAGAAKTASVKKCMGGDAGKAAPAAATGCDAKAAEKKLAGAAKTSFVKKCVAEAK